jgi:AcrR family transcriptional regulator
MDGFQRRREKKMKNIKAAAFRLFVEKGPKDVGVTEIAKEAGVSQVTIYNYFGSKDSLYQQVFYDYMDEKLTESEKIVAGRHTFKEKIDQLFFDKNEAAARAEKAFIDLDVQDPKLLEMIQSFGENRTYPMLLRLIEQGKKEGYLDPNLPEKAVLMYINSFRSFLDDPTFFSKENKRLRESVAQLYFFGLCGKAPTIEK